MNRSFLIATFLLIALGLFLGADYLVARTLNAQLGPLLTRELGLPVTLAPMKVRLAKLTARTPKLVMGDPANPSVVADDVEVSISLSKLLEGEVRLVTASAADLMVNISLWPSSGGPLPEDYLFLDQWLPKELVFDTGRYVNEDGGAYPLREFEWHREKQGNVRASWLEDRKAGELKVDVALPSLQDLLTLAPLQLQGNAALTDKAASAIALAASIKPGKKSGYVIDAEVEAADMTANIVASNPAIWTLPSRSNTQMKVLEIDKFRDLLSSYSDGTGKGTDDPLQPPLPALDLPPHLGNVAIDQVRLDDEVVENTSFDFSSGGDGLHISSLTGTGPAGILRGHFDIDSTTDGWELELEASMSARHENQSIAAKYLDADWLWKTGNARLSGRGATWGGLLNSLTGELRLEGKHRGEEHTPVTLGARLDNNPGELTLNHIEVTLGKGSLTGSARLTGKGRRKLTLDATAQQLDLDFLFEEPSAENLPGIAIPEYLGVLPGIDLDWKLNITGLTAPNMRLSKGHLSLQRSATGGQLHVQAVGLTNGELDLRLNAKVSAHQPSEIKLIAHLDKLDVPALFQQDMLLNTRSTGTIAFNAKGKGMTEIFKSLKGTAVLELDARADHDWQRAQLSGEAIHLSSAASLVIEKDRILGLELSALDIDSTQQDITGTVSIVAERKPWLVADLESDTLDIAGIRSLIPDSPEEADESNVMQAIRELGDVRVSLDAKTVVLPNYPLNDVTLEVSSAPDMIKVEKLNFSVEDNALASSAEISWKGDQAHLSAEGSIKDFDLDRFLIRDNDRPRIPVSGSLKLSSRGESVATMLKNLTGHIDLEASTTRPDAPLSDRRKLVFKAAPTDNGMEAKIDTFQWGESDIAGDIHYRTTTPPSIDVTLRGGTLSLDPWEKLMDAPAQAPGKNADSDDFTQVARASARAVGQILRAPAKLFGGTGEAKPGDKFFSPDPLPFDIMSQFDVRMQGNIDAISSRLGTLKDLQLDATLKGGELNMNAKAGHINEGKGAFTLLINSAAQPPAFKLDGSFEDVHSSPPNPGSPQSAVIALTTVGASEVELAANLNGQVYAQMGKGPLNFSSMTLLTTSLGTKMMNALIPGQEQREPKLECAVTLAEFKNGLGVTPFGYAARTPEANLIGRMQVDLHKETMRLEFDSRSREGVGLSLGSVFSNTVRITGPLTDPQIVPKTTGLLWRGWAAFMTAGLSVVGESVLKRALASGDPCKAIQKDIREELCGTDVPLAASPMVCPAA